MHPVAEKTDLIGIRLRQDSMPQIEDVSSALGSREQVLGAFREQRAWGKKQYWVEIALECDVEAKLLSRELDRSSPIDADDSATRTLLQLQEAVRSRSEVNDRDTERHHVF